MSRTRFPASGIVGFAFSAVVFTTPRASAGDWYVDINDAQCATGTGGPNDPFCNIAAAISAAANGDRIHVAAGTYFERLTIDKSLTLLGTSGAAATIVDGSQSGTVITIHSAATVDLEGFTLTHGLGKYSGRKPNGGGLTIRGSCMVSLSACDVSGNVALESSSFSADGFGGGIFVGDATLSVTASTIANNAADRGGGIYNDGGTVTMLDSIVSGNRAGATGVSGAGGGIYSLGQLQITRSKITANYIDSSVYVFYGAAGGIHADSIDGSEVEISGNHGLGMGGGIIASGSLTDSWIEGNDAAIAGGVDAEGLVLTRCAIRWNKAAGDPSGGGAGGGVLVGGRVASRLVDCLVEGNEALGPGGGVTFSSVLTGIVSFERCIFRDNVATGGDGGGAILTTSPFSSTSTFVFSDCAFDGNSANHGGGFWCSLSQSGQQLSFLRCTIGGNVAWYTGGGILVDAASQGTVVIGGTVVAGNSVNLGGTAVDCDGTLVSNGYNCVGDTTGCTITGSSTGNLLDVDPLYFDPGNGDFTLQPTSPCVEAGDPSDPATGKDAAGDPRLLDGNFDRVLALDMGAFEFDHVHLAIQGNATPGGTLTFDTEGTIGLPLLMVIGVAEGELRVRPFGALLVDLSAPALFVPWGTIPNQQTLQVPVTLPVPVTVFFQELASDVTTGGGNLGNVVRLPIR